MKGTELSRRGWYLAVGGAVMVVIGLFAMRFPVFISDFDQWGWQVKCGTGFTGDLRQAADATNGTHFVSSCESALLLRRLWAIPLVVVGAIAFIGMMLATALESLREAMPAPADGNRVGSNSEA
jgi:hypothetical protein